MTEYDARVSVTFCYVIETDDQESAEFEALSLAKEDYPEGTQYDIYQIKKIGKE